VSVGYSMGMFLVLLQCFREVNVDITYLVARETCSSERKACFSAATCLRAACLDLRPFFSAGLAAIWSVDLRRQPAVR
jgi:phosphopantetheinyl transferase